MNDYAEIRKKEYEQEKATIAPRTFMLNLSDNDTKALFEKAANAGLSKEYLFEYFGRLHYQMATDIKFVMFKTHSFSENYTEGLHIKINPKDYCKKCGKKLSNVNFNGIEKTIGICMEHLMRQNVLCTMIRFLLLCRLNYGINVQTYLTVAEMFT